MKRNIRIHLMTAAILALCCIVMQAGASGYYTKDTAKTIYAGRTYEDEGGSDYWLCFTTPKDPCVTELRTCSWARAARVGAIHTEYSLETAGGKALYKTGEYSRGEWKTLKVTLEPNTKYYIHIYALEDVVYRNDAACGYELKILFTGGAVPLDDTFTLTLSKTKADYTGKAIKPTVTLKDSGGNTLTKGTDYTVSYKNNIDAGTATVTVTGKGSYTGTLKKTFKILPAELTNIKLKKAEYDYTGKAIKPAVTVKAKVNGKTVTLTSGTDYKLTYAKNTNAGTATVKATGKGNFTGNVKAAFTIRPVKITALSLANTVVYTGKALTPEVTVKAKVNGKTVTLAGGTDYTVTYAGNKAIGTAAVTVTGKGNFKGSLSGTFRIVPGIPKLTARSGKAQTAKLSVKAVKGASGYEFHYQKADSNKSRLVLTPKKTCEITGLENKKEYLFKVRAYAVTASGETVFGDFSDTVKVTIDAGKDISEGKMTIGSEGMLYVYTGKAIKPAVTVKLGLFKLKKGTDYTLTYENNVNAGTATVTAEGIGEYSGKLSGSFVIGRAPINDGDVYLQTLPFTYTGEAIEPTVIVMIGDKGLVKGTDYKLSYSKNKNAGTGCAVVTGIGNYAGTVKKPFTILPVSLALCEVSLPDGDSYAYTEDEVRPAVQVKYGDRVIPMNDKTYKVEYADNIEIGTATAVVTGIKNLTGSVTLEFEITGWRYPMTDCYVCGNDWSEYYAPKAADGRPDHVGIDVKSSSGDTSIYAAANGTIAAAGYNSANGNYIVISHDLNGQMVYTFYAHLSEIIRSSGNISMGEKIGVMGNTGTASKGAHLHFAVVSAFRSGSYVGYAPAFSGSKTTYNSVTFYDPHYVITNGRLP